MLPSQVMVDTQREGSVTEEPFLTTKATTRLALTSHGCVEERNERFLTGIENWKPTSPKRLLDSLPRGSITLQVQPFP